MPVPVVVPVTVNVLSPRGVGVRPPDVVATVKVALLALRSPVAVGKLIAPKVVEVPAGLAVKVKKFVSVGNPVVVERSSKVTLAVYVSVVAPSNTVLSPVTPTLKLKMCRPPEPDLEVPENDASMLPVMVNVKSPNDPDVGPPPV